jgi:ketopantoate reductase
MKLLVFGLGSIGSYLYFLIKKNLEKFKDIDLFLLTYNKREFNSYSLVIFDKKKLIDKIKIEINYNLKRTFFDIVILTPKSYDIIKYISFLLKNNIKFRSLVLTQNGVGQEEEVLSYLKNEYNTDFSNIYFFTILTALDLIDNNLYIYNLNKSEIVVSSYKNELNNEILKLIDIIKSIVYVSVYNGNYNDVRYSKLFLNLIMNIVPAFYEKDIKETYKNLQAVEDEKNLIIEFLWFMKKINLKLYKFKYYNTKFIAFLYKYLPSFIIYFIYNQDFIISKIRAKRVPSFIKDYIINPKEKTEIEYYLGKILKKADESNIDMNNLKTVAKIYNKLRR